MKAEETRRNLINELNIKFAKTGSFFGISEEPGDPVVTFPSPTFEKPKMFEPSKMNMSKNDNYEIQAVRGIGFKDNTINISKPLEEKKTSKEKSMEIYNMQELIQSNPEGMRTLSIDTKTVKAQYALVKRREWQDILFEDIDWFKPIDLASGIKKVFHFNL